MIFYLNGLATAPSQELLLAPHIGLEGTNWFLGAFYGGKSSTQIFTFL